MTPGQLRDWHTKPPTDVRSVDDAMKDAERQRRELPQVVQVRALDWDKVILADAHAALLDRHAELEKIAEELSLWCIDSAAHKAFMAWRDAK